KAAKIYRRAVELGDVDAMRFLGEMYDDGLGVKLDKKKAARLYRTAADRGDAIAQCHLGFLLESQEKHEEAFRYYALSADQGYTDGENNLGACYMDGEGTEVDLGKARYWFERAAAKGIKEAIDNYVFGTCVKFYRCGLYGLAKSDKKAAKIWKRSVELGDVEAMAELGGLYHDGSGVKLDEKKAARLYRAAADRGDAVAQNNLAAFLHAEKKFEESFRYFSLAANQGYTFAENSIGMCYGNGTGTEVDLGKARYWFERAAAKGDETATRNLSAFDARASI
ncbi:hypothetical protein AURANDRAFT_31968, partial [Aureococcus anophagefferens]